jgi:hypothetical protein
MLCVARELLSEPNMAILIYLRTQHNKHLGRGGGGTQRVWAGVIWNLTI